MKSCVQPLRVTLAKNWISRRQEIANLKPDILLTNFMMLELLLTRQDQLDQSVIENARGLEFLVLDELHTYRGRQGADVAMLVRRVKERLAGKEKVTLHRYVGNDVERRER